MIIALTGLPRCGKDTAARFLVQQRYVEPYSFALPGKRALCELFNWTLESFDSDDKDAIDPFWKISKRQALEFILEKTMKDEICKQFPLFSKEVGRNIWVKRFEHFLLQNKNKDILLSDLRFVAEYQYLQTLNAPIILITRPNYSNPSDKWYDIKSFEYTATITNYENQLEQFKQDILNTYDKLKEKEEWK